MKTFLQHATIFLIFIPLLFLSKDNRPLIPQVNQNDLWDYTNDTQSIESSDWYSKAIQNIKKEEYYITYSGQLGGYQSPNRTQNLRFIYDTDGFTVKPRMLKIPLFDQNDQTLQEKDKQYRLVEDWQVTMKVAGYGKTNSLNSFNGKEINVSNNLAYIEDKGLKIEYENNEKGMRQNFIVKEKTEGKGFLKVMIFADTELRMRTGAEAVVFTNDGSEEKLKYNSLKVWDAENKILTAHFEKEEINVRENNIKQFAIVVNDDNAVYPITIDPLSSTANWTAEGDQALAQFGWSVSTAGDVNGDGYSDVIVGAYVYDNGQSNEGRAFVYHGSAAGLSATANWTAESNQTNAYFGNSVSTAGDVNGDGYSDVIVGAHFYANGESNEGRAYVYHGSASGLSATSNWTAEGNQVDAFFGISVSTAGDVNGDGYSDVIVGAPYYDNGETEEGRAFVYHGSASGLSIAANWTAESNQASAILGCSVSTAGDVNGDGYSDVIVGASFYDNSEFEEGRAFVYHGSASGLSAANWTAESNQTGALFGSSVSTAGDVNGDGYSDVIVGAYYYDNGGILTDEGRAFVYHGSASGLSATTNWTVGSNQISAQFGYSVSTAGDVNGDGYSDVIVGAPLYDNGETDEGRAYVYHGSASGLSFLEYWSAESNQTGAYFGNSVSTAGDVNGDGYCDVIVGARNYNNGEPGEGRAFVYHGSAWGLSPDANWTAESNQATAYFGISVSTAGDVNGDGYSDVIVGARNYDNGESNEGRAFVYHGSASGLSATANWTAEGNQAIANFGISVSTAGDVNGDGYSDVIVGAYRYDNVESDEGRAYVYHGSASGLSAIANWTAESNQTSAYFGYSVSTAGDVNGDGYSDVIVGAYYYDNGETDEGSAFVYHGSASGLSVTSNWTAEGNQESAQFGWSVSTAGDVNGDGYSDVIVGTVRYYHGEIYEGRAYVYHGSASGLSATSNWAAEGNQESAQFGWSVSTAGDVNGDGYSDVIVGAYGYDNGEPNEGRAYVYHGSASGLSATSNWTAEGNQVDAWFGYSVSTAGDVNGDGYSDVIVGARNYGIGQSNEGRAFVYHGSASGLSATLNWFAEVNQVDAFFGTSVSTAGDVNGDGYSDVIVGAPYYDNGATDEGRAFVFYGNFGLGLGLQSTIQQYRSGTSTVIGPHGITGIDGQLRFNGFAKSPFGRADGKLVYEYVENGLPFGSIVNSSGSQSAYSDLGTAITGIDLNEDVSGITTMKNYRWRARVKYNPVNNPHQVYGPWRYYTSYQPTSFGSFKPQDAPLPVELFLFDASVEKGDVKLNWITQTEVNNYGFEIERKIEDDWHKLGFVQGNGNSNSPKRYSYIDNKPVGGNQFQYRLKQIDNDGHFEYSDIVEVELIPLEFALYQNYPNPFNSITRIKYQLPQECKVIIKIYNIIGAEVLELINDKKEAGIYEVEFNADNLSSGTYFYRILTGSFVETKKMLLLK